ncbi:MAG: hypothetical protein A2086_16150 [Spirochaetes bacterium GWD1_27_9]|nr:MAG: hypothetical protein A2Z98_07060 [Spirochaetes bacterium GWB1_27_13]OHD21502.1 MAG: hypothetical protein A2Y34_01490 [Spirochaetes bacterium GWC1_27_15]OHD44184.1 MAG: hypothetical protein A2086_16150 [Spirochaetes bacterium GWD1_27_9]
MKIVFEDVYKRYKIGKVDVNALNGISLTINKGEFVCIAGPSGSGKTTLLNLIGCLDSSTTGNIYFDDYNITNAKEKVLEKIRKEKIGFIFQSFNLIETLNVFENIEYPSIGKKVNKKELYERIENFLKEIEITELKKRFPNELSGGQKQRVAIARAFVNQPQIILADEPTANLDSATANKVISLMKRINKEQNTSLIFSTHDYEIMNMADRIIRIHDGKVKGEEIKNG